MQTSLWGIAKRAKEDSKHRFGNLYSLLNESNLLWCFSQLNRNAAPGIDKTDWKAFKADLAENVRIDHDWLMKMLKQRVEDRAFLDLIRKWLKAGILEEDAKVVYPVTGTPQGGVVSAVLANIYLHFVLDLWFDKIVKPRCEGDAMLTRFADDYVCCFQYHRDLQKLRRSIDDRLVGLAGASRKFKK